MECKLVHCSINQTQKDVGVSGHPSESQKLNHSTFSAFNASLAVIKSKMNKVVVKITCVLGNNCIVF
jgi:hypothetical protein